MNLSDYELLPGVVISVKDEECLGRIKVALPNAESTSNTQLNALPWCYPLFMTGTYQGFTKLVDNCKVWVLRNKLDKLEMWYWPMVDLNPNTQNIVAPYDNPDVLISRDMGGQNAYIYYTDGQGIVLSIGQTKININEKGEIILTTGKGSLKVSGESVFLNTDSNNGSDRVAKFGPIDNVVNKIYECLLNIQNSAAGSCLTSHISSSLAPTVSELKGMITDSWAASENVFTN